MDPNTPPGQEPYVWVFDKNGKNRRKKSPQNIFKETDLYTIQKPGKEKVYAVEESLSVIEGKYADVFRRKIKNKLPLSSEEHAVLSFFVGAMLIRTLRHKDTFDHFIDQVVEHAEAMEKAHGISNAESSKWRGYKTNAHGIGLASTLPDVAKLLNQMSLAFLCVDPKKPNRFITSDDPCNLFNPELQWQKFYGPGLGMRGTEVAMALSPEIMLTMSWSNFRGYIYWDSSHIEDSNRMIRGHCYEYFISHRPKTKWRWFRSYPLDLFFIFKMARILSWQKIQRIISNYKYYDRRRKIKNRN